MVEVLLDSSLHKYKGFTFTNNDISITYGYYYNKLYSFMKSISRNRGDIIKMLEGYSTRPIKKSQDFINFSELIRERDTYITRFTIHIPTVGFSLEYEYLLYHILYEKLGNELLQFPRNETFFISKNINHMGYVLNPMIIPERGTRHDCVHYVKCYIVASVLTLIQLLVSFFKYCVV